MPETDSGAGPAADEREARRLKRTGRTCIGLFVIFLIVLLAFGRAPVVKTTSDRGYQLHFDFISCLGVIAGAFALLFLPINLGRIVRLSAVRKVLGLIGAVGLICHAALALFMPLSYGTASQASALTAGYAPLGQGGPEQWVIDGKPYSIASTYYLPLPEGLQYTIEYPYVFLPTDRPMTDERALEIAFPLMKHAYLTGLYRRRALTTSPTRIGVTLLEQQGGSVRGYRVGLALEEIRTRVDRPATHIATSQPGG